ncbi:MAG: LLM class flavin-dependent oxidoreductase [Actinobacteria bacterium]|nr:LLM class flavin-dependent oxidoreductase [Actinomycetota bacterium]
MDFSVFMIAMGKGRTDAETYADVLSDVRLAEELGFDTFWFAEHHFNREFSLSPSPNLFIAAASQITERIKLGTAVNVLPYHNPIRVAEEGAMLDILTGGRLQWGIGRGYPGPEFNTYKVDPTQARERFEEIHDIVIAAWKTGTLEYDGAHYEVPTATLAPRPVQDPHPPVWMTAMSPQSVAWAAQHDYPAMQVAEPLSIGREHLERYRAAAAEAGVETRRGGLAPLRYIYVADTDEAAGEACRPHIKEFWEHFTKVANPAALDITPGYEYWQGERNLMQYSDLDYEGLNEIGAIITGSPQTVIEGIRRQVDALESTHILCDFWRGVTSADDRQRSMRMFAEEVMPAFQDVATPVAD